VAHLSDHWLTSQCAEFRNVHRFVGQQRRIIAEDYTSIGGDTQLLGNFEYRIPIITDAVSIAAFADIVALLTLGQKVLRPFRVTSWTTNRSFQR
jgi:hypothetical protein